MTEPAHTPNHDTEFKTNLQRWVEDAYDFAVDAHGDQKYGGEAGGGLPYRYHLAQVALKLLECGYDACTVAVGLLHDVVEDTDVTSCEIEFAFPEPIPLAVNNVTEFSAIALWASLSSDPEERRRHKVERAMKNPISHAVKWADSFCNLENNYINPIDDDRMVWRRKKYLRNVEDLEQGLPSPDDVSELTNRQYALTDDERKNLIEKFKQELDKAEHDRDFASKTLFDTIVAS